MNILGETTQLGGLQMGQRFVFEEDAQMSVFAPGAIHVLVAKTIENGCNLIVVAPDHRPGSKPPPDTHRKLDYSRRVRPLE